MAFRSTRIVPSDITPPEVFFNRRAILAGALAGGVSALASGADLDVPAGGTLKYTVNSRYCVKETPNRWDEITSYNNYYEFGTDKDEPKEEAASFKPEPWSVTIDGEAEVKGKFALEDLLKPFALQERIYRFRCVEAWSMVIPWVGFPLGDLLKRFKPTSKAKYIEMTTLYDPSRMPGQRVQILEWPYVEGLRMDEAMHPLTLLVVGLYGRVLPNQDGAPLRLIVPWKYGFKSIKAIVRIRFTERQPRNSWNIAAPNEYGFYANVNPHVDHPRWSQATERRIGASLFAERQPTLMFNGYADQVASLYRGMDLRRYF